MHNQTHPVGGAERKIVTVNEFSASEEKKNTANVIYVLDEFDGISIYSLLMQIGWMAYIYIWTEPLPRSFFLCVLFAEVPVYLLFGASQEPIRQSTANQFLP